MKKKKSVVDPEKNFKPPIVIVVMPAFNAEKTVEKTFNDIPQKLISKVILVDDASKDKTARIANKLGIKVFRHQANLGYGGNQKTCYWEALKEKPDVVVMLHPDYQYDGSLTGELIRPILEGRYDIMFGNRVNSRREALEGGMPLIKYILNRIFALLENFILGANFSEYFSGFRAYSRQVLETVPFQRFSNDFVFDQQLMISAYATGFRIGEIPIPVRYFPEASSIRFLKGGKFLLETLWTLFLFILFKLGVYKSKIFSETRMDLAEKKILRGSTS